MVAVSVIIPAYNAADTIEAQLRALSAQSFRDEIEVVVADNGSVDTTASVVSEISRQVDVPIFLVDASARRGPSYAVNTAARVARGNLLLICNADDIATDEWVELMVNALRHDAFVAGPLIPFIAEPGDLPSWDRQDNFTTWSNYCHTAATANVGISRDLFESVGGMDERFLAAEDVDLAARVYESGVLLHPADGVMWYRQRATAREWNRNLAWCVSWDIAAQEVRRDRLPLGARRSAGRCLNDLAKQFIDFRRWPSQSGTSVSFWASQTHIKWGRVKGHVLKRRRLKAAV